MNTPFQIAVFDLDGTLLNTLDDLTDAVNMALANAGFPARTREEVRTFVGNGVELLMRRAVPAATAEADILACFSDFKATYARICRQKTAPYPGILPLLDELRTRGVRIAVVSNKFDAAVKELCAHYFGSRVEVAVGEREADGVRKKPAPDTVFEALRLLNAGGHASSPARAVYIGDSDVDIDTARNAALPCLSVTWGFRDESFLLAHGATTLVHTTEELLTILTND